MRSFVRAPAAAALAVLFSILLSAGSAIAQSYPPPTRAASPSTPDQAAALRDGTALHDQGKYNEAIAKYQEVLAQNPGNMTALYELAFTYSALDDHSKALEAARRGIAYKSPQLPQFYDLIGSSLDSMGQPAQAIEAYRKGVEYVPRAANLYYNMAVTYYESLKKPDEARRALEKAVGIEPTNADTELLLGQIFESTGYRTPGFFALSKFLIIRPAGQDTLQGYGVWRRLLRAGMAPVRGTARGNAGTAAPPPPEKADEGNFADIDRQFALSQVAAQDAMDKGRSEIEALVGQIDAILTRIAAHQPHDDRSFVWTHYARYFIELKEKNFVQPFVYWISQRAPVPGVREWLEANQPKLREYLDWTLQYKWPTD
jgi:tetratricopeptide (TPR) repeat protein